MINHRGTIFNCGELGVRYDGRYTYDDGDDDVAAAENAANDDADVDDEGGVGDVDDDDCPA